MQPQDVAANRCGRQVFATFTPQRMRFGRYPFIFPAFSAIVPLGYSQDTSYPVQGQAGQHKAVLNEKKTRRDTCLRASRLCLQLASLPSSQHAQKNQSKSSWSLTQNQSRLNRLTPVNTSNSDWGQRTAASDYSAARQQTPMRQIPMGGQS